jgi:ABC-type arginine transport system ATPase subunit/ABC-type spermidine/putrescine transport system permease subunit II
VTMVHRLFTAGAVERKKQRLDRVAYAVGFTAASLLIVPLATIVGYLAVKAWPALSWELVTQNPSRFMTAGGVWAPLVGTAYVVVFSLAMAAPVGVLAGIYLKEYAGDTWLTRVVSLAVMNLAGIPSIVHALFGVGVFVLAAGWGRSVLAASCTLAIMTLPVIITSTIEALSAVPITFREACWNLGASRWQTIRTLVLRTPWGASSPASSCKCRELPAKPLRFSSPALYFIWRSPRQGVRALRRRVGMVFPLPVGLPFSIYDNVAYAPRVGGVHDRAELNAIVEDSLRQAALWDEVKDRLDLLGTRLSGGQQQRLTMARALSHRPEILCLNRFSIAVDPLTTMKIVVCGQVPQARRLADRVALMNAGRVVAEGRGYPPPLTAASRSTLVVSRSDKQSGGEIVYCAVERCQLGVIRLRNVDAKPVVQVDHEVEEIHGVEIELLSENGVRLQLLWIDLWRNAGERLYYSGADLVTCHSVSGAWSARSKAVRNDPATRPSTAR